MANNTAACHENEAVANGADAVGDARARVPRWWRALGRWVPALAALEGYGLRSLRADLTAGVTVAAVAVPQAMAYAMVIGLPPQYGLYTAIVMTTVGALFDSSRQLINGPTNAISIAVLSALIGVPEGGRLAAAVLLALLVGAIQVAITALRLGDLTRFVSHSVIVGFTCGAATLLIAAQAPVMLGFAGDGGWRGVGAGWTAALGIGTVAVVLGLRWLNARPLARRLGLRAPEYLLALVGAAALVWGQELDARGVAVVGAIPAALPRLSWPTVSWEAVRLFSGDAMAIALLGLLEAIAMAKAIAAQTRQRLDLNQQCLSEGLANVAGSLFQCFPGSGSLTRSWLNREAGAVSQWSGVFSAAAVAATVLLLAPYAAFIPRASLAAILVLTASRMVDLRGLRDHLRATRFDAGIVAATAVSAVAISIEFCIVIGVFLSFALYVPRAAKVQLTELVLAPERTIRPREAGEAACARMLLFNVEGEMFFGSAPDFERLMAEIDGRAVAGVRVVILRLREVSNPDAACLLLLDGLLRGLKARGVQPILCGVRGDLARGLERIGASARLGAQWILLERERAWTGIQEAIDRGRALLGPEGSCERCPLRQERAPAARQAWFYQI